MTKADILIDNTGYEFYTKFTDSCKISIYFTRFRKTTGIRRPEENVSFGSRPSPFLGTILSLSLSLLL